MSKLRGYSVDNQGLVKKKPAKANSVLSNIRLKPQATTVKVIVEEDRLKVESDGYFMCMLIKHTGIININPTDIPEGWVVNQGLTGILIYAFSDKDTPEFSFPYSGEINVSKVEWANAVDDKKYYAEIQNKKKDFWNTIRVVWPNATSEYNNYSSGSQPGHNIRHKMFNRPRMKPVYKGENK